jgi:hypothetical protein
MSKSSYKITIPSGKDGDAAIAFCLTLKCQIESLGGIPKHPELWEDDIVIYNNSLLEQLEDLKAAKTRTPNTTKKPTTYVCRKCGEEHQYGHICERSK